VENQERDGMKKFCKWNRIKPSSQLVIMMTMGSTGDNHCHFQCKSVYIQCNKQSLAASDGLTRNTKFYCWSAIPAFYFADSVSQQRCYYF
jgi:hypothetical protein